MTAPVRDSVWPQHMRLSWGGTIGNPAIEQWSNTVRWHFGGLAGLPGIEPDAADLQTACDALRGPVHDWMQNASSGIGTQAKATWVKFNWVNAAGLQRDSNTVVSELDPTVNGGTANINPPWMMTHALTLRTANRRGRAHAGRIFPPLVCPPQASNQGALYTDAGACTNMATSFVAFLDACKVIIEASILPPTSVERVHAIIVSPGSTSRGTPAITADITGVAVDRVPDIQHRRTHSVPRAEVATVPLFVP